MDQKLLYPVIWGIVQQIPLGYVATYGQIAKLTELYINPRSVGYALKVAPESLKLPWHRVINSQGKISFPFGTKLYEEQRACLVAEGINVEGGRVNLTEYLWQQP